jgi:hypothetical protein
MASTVESSADGLRERVSAPNVRFEDPVPETSNDDEIEKEKKTFGRTPDGTGQ